VIASALEFTEKERRIVTVGIKPSRPETGYGYIESGCPVEGEVLEVKSFKEKPCLEVAKQYLEDGGYLWNAGIFVWNIDTITSCLRSYTPDLAAIMDEMSEAFYTDQEPESVDRLFPTCEKISIDYAVMEKADCIYTIPADFGWSDLGTWGSLRTLMDRNEEGNADVGHDVRIFDCKDCIIHVPDLGKVVVQGLEGYIVAQHGDRLIVCRLDHEQGITQYSK
jgi:mannose-1-phosphate guanylyltransferase